MDELLDTNHLLWYYISLLFVTLYRIFRSFEVYGQDEKVFTGFMFEKTRNTVCGKQAQTYTYIT